MSGSATIRCRRENGSTLLVEVAGAITEADGVELASVVQAELGPAGRIDGIIFDLRKLTGCELLGRARLCELQAWLKGRARRTAYLTATPRFRGMTLIVIHTSEDENASTFVTREQADEWLAASQDRAAVHARIVGGAR